MKKQIIIGIDYSTKNIYICRFHIDGRISNFAYKDKISKNKHNEIDFYNEVLSLINPKTNFNADYKIFIFMEKSLSEQLAEVKGMIKTRLIDKYGNNIRFYNLFSSDIIKMLNFTELLLKKEPKYFRETYINKDGTYAKYLSRPDMKKCFKYHALNWNHENNKPQDFYDCHGIAKTGALLLKEYGEEWEKEIRKTKNGKKINGK